jgi:hypothetical protein
VTCPHCGTRIAPDQQQRVDWDHMECPGCESDSVLKQILESSTWLTPVSGCSTKLARGFKISERLLKPERRQFAGILEDRFCRFCGFCFSSLARERI